jgi:hypothetical protein
MNQPVVGRAWKAGRVTDAASSPRPSFIGLDLLSPPYPLLIAVLVIGLGGYAVSTVISEPAFPVIEPTVHRPTPSVPSHLAALSGVWEGITGNDLPTRLVVEEVHEHWAAVLYTWGDHPDGRFHKGWARVNAKVLPNGKLFWNNPGHFTFQLSEDRTMLVGKREQAGRTATSRMRRVSAEVAPSPLTPGEN